MAYSERCHLAERGFILLPVVLAITLIAVIAFTLNNQGSLNIEETGGQLEAIQAEHVARAGLAHAQWRANNSGCLGDDTLTNVQFGTESALSYSGTVVSTATATNQYTLTPDRDTWIKEAFPDEYHPSDNTLSVRNIVGDSYRSLYHFDLSSIPSGARVVSASLRLYTIISDKQRAIRLHSITTDWSEMGATWNSIGNSYEEQVIGSISPQSSNGNWASVNLTATIQSWINNPTMNHGFLLVSTSTNVESKYASREASASQHPTLEIVTANGDVSSVKITSTGTLATDAMGNDITRTFKNSVPAHQPATSLTLQPGATQSKDIGWISEKNSSWNYGAHDTLSVDYNNGDRVLIEFNLGRVPPGSMITTARLELYNTYTQGQGNIHMHRLSSPWTEGSCQGTGCTADGATWDSTDGVIPWNTPGGDYVNTPTSTSSITTIDTWYTWNITTLVQDWIDGTHPNYGILLASDPGVDGNFASSDHANINWHPRLIIDYACVCGNPCLASHSEGNVLMVVGNGSTPASNDVYKKALLESWGYTVTLLDDGADQTSYTSEFASNDVIYISGSVDSGVMYQEINKAPIAIVYEDGTLNNKLGIAQSYTWPVGDSIEITNTSHYITSPFTSGTLPIYDAGMGGLTLSGLATPDLQDIAVWGSAAGLVTLETGTTDSTGGTTSARRVMLPFGPDSHIDWHHVNDSGLLILQRALDWGASGDGLPWTGPVFEEFTEAALGSNGTSLAISKPAGTAAGDLLVAAVVTDGNNTTSLAAPAGWNVTTVVDRNRKVTLGVWWKLASAAESSNYDFTWANNEHAYGWIMRFSGHDPGNPINGNSYIEGSSASPSSVSLTTTVDNSLILNIGGFDDDDITAGDPGLAGTTTINMSDSGDGATTVSGGSGYVQQLIAGNSTASSFILTAAEEFITVTIAIAPAP